ncbi:alpha/beta hydrolase [Mycobacterium paraseoulense]|uniref:Alpha/beta hydrolase n=1 Tax=Mycobacterium paraseoulense TaxID=590652 RepID=A0A1X0II33_9MYCO|nr:alpha/beta hydrolase [Mycobacterium paraseoulense]MCV7395300.1 hypothetical protein [Mycobacterium paraseoulense]ORB46336.1 hypothetical protein BST39_00410 [Mycobacterium paraseoulense]BBZ71691.1 hypothetical protein MPRS_27840 [Mycobacterium paraseoulense]
MQLIWLNVADLIAQAGGDPWAINRSLQAGSPLEISQLAGAFHDAGRCTAEADHAFEQARQRFDAAWNHQNGDHPINDSAEVQRTVKSLGAQSLQLPKIAADLETIAAALAEAQKAGAQQIAALERQLQLLDKLIGAAMEDLKDRNLDANSRSQLESLIKDAKADAADETRDALHQLQSIRDGYSNTLQKSLGALHGDGYDQSGIQAVEGPLSPVPDLPDDPKEFAQVWSTLTPAQKDREYQRNPLIGNHNGMPAVDRDHYNRLDLADELGRAQAAAAQADALKAQHPDWAEGKNIPAPNEPGAIFDDRLAYEAWQRRYDAARDGAKYLPDLQAVDRTVKASPDRKLMLLDTKTGKQARAAIAVGDPDTATHVSVTAPGLNTTVRGAIGGMVSEATDVRKEALRQLNLTPGHEHDTVSAIAWIGYDPPQVPGFDDLGKSLAGGWDVSHDAVARAGAHDLAGFYDGIQAAHHGGPADLTAIGHSYGSLTTGLALQEPGDHGVSRALFYGSPGIEASTPRQLHLQPGHVFTMETPDDPIQWTYDGPAIAHDVAPFLPPPFRDLAESVLGTADATGAGHFGPNPATNPNFTHLATGPATVPDGHGGTLTLQDAHGHSDYPRFPDGGGLRTTNYNIAAVLAGLGDKAVPTK